MLKSFAAGAAAIIAVGVGVAVHASSADAVAARCTASQLVPESRGSYSTPGKTNAVWRLTNKSSATCTLYGWPYFVNYRSDGRTLYSVNSHTGTPHVVTVAPEEHARVLFTFDNPNRNCPAERTAGMTLSWDGTAHPVIAPVGVRACKGTATAGPLVHG